MKPPKAKKSDPELSIMATARADFLHLVTEDEHFMRKVLVHSINHRVQDFADPLTSTLIIMATSPLQLMICEAGIMLFRTNSLPIFPFDKLKPAHRALILDIVERAGDDGAVESYHGCGKYSLHVLLGNNMPTLSKRRLLVLFVQAMSMQQTYGNDPHTMKQLCNIILQRFLSGISVPSEDQHFVMHALAAA